MTRIGLVLWVVLMTFAVQSLVWSSGCKAAEFGIDVGANLQLPDDSDEYNLEIAAPFNRRTSQGLEAVRVGFAISDEGRIEVAPSLSFRSSRDFTGSKFSSTRMGIGTSFVLGDSRSSKASPYLRIGGHVYAEDGDSDNMISQVGISGGAGLRWRVSGIFGVRSEIVGLRWFHGDFPASWELAFRVGISAFTGADRVGTVH